MEETRGVGGGGGGGGGRKGGGGMWDEEDEANNDNKKKEKKKKHLHFNLEAEGGLFFFSIRIFFFVFVSSLLPLLSPIISAFGVYFVLYSISQYFNVTTSAFKLLFVSVCAYL